MPVRSSLGRRLPVSVAVDDFTIDRLDLAAPVAGTAASLHVAGDLALASEDEGHLRIEGKRLGEPGSYTLTGSLTPERIAARLDVSEPAHGLVAGLSGLPELGALSVSASIDGPRNAEQLRLQASAGPLTADVRGKVDLVGKTVDLDLDGVAPAMTPRPGFGWRSARIEAHIHGPFSSPAAIGQLDIDHLKTAGGSLRRVVADIKGDNGSVELTASATELRLASAPDLFAATPVKLQVRAALNAPRRPVSFTLSHPRLAASGEIDTAGELSGSATLNLPSLAPFAAIVEADLQGRADLTARFTRLGGDAVNIGVDGTVGATGGLPFAVALLGDKATLALTASLHDGDVRLDNLALDGKALTVSAKGRQIAGKTDLDWRAAVSDLSAVSPRAAGTVSAEGHLAGPPDDLSATAQLTGEAAIGGTPKGNFTVSLTAQGLPRAPSGKIAAEGRLAGAPLRLDAAATREHDGTLSLVLGHLEWKSASGEGRLSLAPNETVPRGQLHLRMVRLEDLAPLAGVAAKGEIDAVSTRSSGKTSRRFASMPMPATSKSAPPPSTG